MFSLENRRILITGTSSGIGRAMAKAFHAQGAHVGLVARRANLLEELAQELGKERVHIFPCDLSQEAETLIPQAEKAMGGVDTLVNNAGITRDNLMVRLKDEDFDEVIHLNLRSAFVLCRAALKIMMKNRFGRIINISSVVALSGNPGQTAYAAAKAGLIGMTKSIAQEVGSRGITANCIAPGFIQTAMTEAISEEHKEHLTAKIPLKSLGSPEDIAAAAIFLASLDAKYITGQTIHVNGGMLMV